MKALAFPGAADIAAIASTIGAAPIPDNAVIAVPHARAPAQPNIAAGMKSAQPTAFTGIERVALPHPIRRT